MSSQPTPQPENKPTPAYVRVFRAYLRNVSSPAVWAPMAIIALLLALSADYWNSLRVLDEDLDGSLISDNTSQLAGSLSDSGSITASEIDSSDVLSSLLVQTEPPATSDKNDQKQAKEQNKPPKLEDVDLLGLPDFSQSDDQKGNDTSQENSGDANAPTPSRRFGLLDLLTGNANQASSTASTSPTNGILSGSTGMFGSRPIAAGSATTAGIAENASATSTTTTGSTLLNTGTTDSNATLTQFNGASTFTGYPYSSVTVPTTPSVNTAPTFTGYPPAAGVSIPSTTPYTGRYTGYPTSPSTVPSSGNSYAPNSYGAPYGTVQYGTQPNLNSTSGINTAPVTSTSPQSGYPAGVSSGTTEVQTPIVPYSVPNSAPGRYIGNGEINTFANP